MGIFQQATLTNLRNLRYGNDTIGGGDSGEPYIITPIPAALDQQADPNDAIGIDGGLIRGGFVGATNASAKDFVRIGKFLKDAPQGPRFIIKQVGLQLSNPQLEAPLGAGATLNNLLQGNFSTLFGGGNNFNTNIGTTRIYNGGINTLLQVPVNAFGGHIVRHGLLPIESNSAKYENVAFNNDRSEPQGANNRLVRLKAKLEKDINANIASYISGPDSVDGIGTTTIPRYNFTLNNSSYLPLTDPLKIGQDGTILNNLVPINNNGYLYAPANPNYYNAQGVSLQYLDNNAALIASNNNILEPEEGRTNNSTENSQFDQGVINYGAAKNYNALQKVIDNQIASNRIGTSYFTNSTGSTGPGTINDENTITSPIVFSITGRSKYKNLDLKTFNIDTRLGLSQANGYSDEVNLTPLYYAENAPGSSYIKIPGIARPTKVRDLIKFRIEAVDNDSPKNSVWMIFRSYLKDITDTPNPSWNTVNYVGRGEPFYIYKGFERNISFTLQVAAMSEEELRPMWQKLNFLYSNTMPDYSNNIMRGPYMRLTLGDYMFRQPGIIKSMTYTIGNDSPWEIAIDDPELPGGSDLYELPHVMTIQMTFAPVHDFVPRKFPRVLNTVPGPGGTPVADWKNLPAFMADRQSNQNKWLTDIFGTNNKIPEGENSPGIQPINTITPAPVVVQQGATINDIVAPTNIPIR